MHWSHIFALCLLISDCKNIYSRNNNVCLGFYVIVFMRIVSMWWFFYADCYYVMGFYADCYYVMVFYVDCCF